MILAARLFGADHGTVHLVDTVTAEPSILDSVAGLPFLDGAVYQMSEGTYAPMDSTVAEGYPRLQITVGGRPVELDMATIGAAPVSEGVWIAEPHLGSHYRLLSELRQVREQGYAITSGDGLRQRPGRDDPSRPNSTSQAGSRFTSHATE